MAKSSRVKGHIRVSGAGRGVGAGFLDTGMRRHEGWDGREGERAAVRPPLRDPQDSGMRLFEGQGR